MNDDFKPEPVIVLQDSALLPGSTATLTGTTATLSGAEAISGVPQGDGEYKFITGADGQTYAVKAEPFVWKKFFIGLGVPLFLMIVPLILSLFAEGIDWDDEYETERVDLEHVNGTAYAANYTLDSDRILEWCYVRGLGGNVSYDCDSEGNSVMRIYAETENKLDLIRGNGTSYYANFSLDSNQSLSGCDIHLWTEESYVYCDILRGSNHFQIIKETWDGEYESELVGHWNTTTEVIDFDDGEDYGSEIEMSIYVNEEVGIWTQEEGVIHFDSGVNHGPVVDIRVETIDTAAEEERNNAQDRIDIIVGISTIMCLAAPLVAIGMIIYGFAASGGKAIGIGATVAIVSYPVIAFFGCIAAFTAGF